ncbi:MAG: (d)CMP kinase [Flavobacteriia bacterium]|nr:MAG: (d)CMP kinase [Flavobacteriia bacterium]
MKKKINIAIDGYSSTGKSTIAKRMAETLGYVYVDTGAMYRAVTYFAVKNHLISKDVFKKEELVSKLNQIDLKFIFNKDLGHAEIYLNGENVEEKIRNLEISNLVSRIAEVSEVRKKLVEQQQKIGKDKGVVMDGRDIGTVVFPDAELKIFMTASAEKRAQRRYKEMIAKGENVNLQEVIKNVTERDHIDTNREDSPLIMAKDAVLLDNSDLDADETFEKAMELVAEKI